MDDRYGSYGTIGLALVEKREPSWELKLLLMSCRGVSRGVGTVLLNHILQQASDHGADVLAPFIDTGRNRMMYLTYRFAGFDGEPVPGEKVHRRWSNRVLQPPPDFLELTTP